MTEEKINTKRFFDFYRERLKFIEKYCFDDNDGNIEGKLLICCYLDALSGYRYKGKSNKSRLNDFLTEFSDYSRIWNKISLMRLKQYFEEKNSGFYDDILVFLRKQGVITPKFTDFNYNPDMDYNTLSKKAIKQDIDKEYWDKLKEDILKFKYSNILWHSYRNSLVHQTLVDIDPAPNICDKKEPFYSHVNFMENKIIREEVRFIIPFVFLLSTFKKCLINFEAYLKNNNITKISLS
ncbi:MAG: hypothetical protein GXO93_08135 [FCB group bacterium]|nr:hypothetical protein [FCB group bacterium]